MVWKICNYFTRPNKHNEKSDKAKIRHTEYNVENVLLTNIASWTSAGEHLSFQKMAGSTMLRPVSSTATHIQNMNRGKKCTIYVVSNVKELVDILWDLLTDCFELFSTIPWWFTLTRHREKLFTMLIFTTRQSVPILQACPPSLLVIT